jgi:hypothetical protein
VRAGWVQPASARATNTSRAARRTLPPWSQVVVSRSTIGRGLGFPLRAVAFPTVVALGESRRRDALELSGLTACMPYTDRWPDHGRLQLTCCGFGCPLGTVIDRCYRCLAAPRRPRWRSVLALDLHESGGGGLEDTISPWRGCSARPYRWVITLEGRLIRKGTAPGRDEAADAVSRALEELLL